jgi:hypothetical protein
MNPITLQVVVHGLVALVPGPAATSGPNHMTALLLDARHPAAHECIQAHHPTLEFRAASTAECNKAGCKVSGTTCICDELALAGKQISLELPPTTDPLTRTWGGSAPPSLPQNRTEAINVGYLSNFPQMQPPVKLNSAFLKAQPPANLLVRMDIPFADVAACALWGRVDDGAKNIHAMSVRTLGSESAANEPSRAIAQMAIATITIPDSEAAKKSVVVHLRSFDSPANVADTTITVQPGKGYRIDLSNDTPAPLKTDAPCDDGVARHFALFYDLLDNPPKLWKDRPVPHLKFTYFRDGSGVANPACDLADLNPNDRPACPMLVVGGPH